MRRYEGSLRGLVFVGHLSRVTARALALNALHILNEDGFRAEGLNLFLRRRANVGRRHLRAKTPGSRNRLKPRNAYAPDKGARGRNRTGRRPHPRTRPTTFPRSTKQPPVTGQDRKSVGRGKS